MQELDIDRLMNLAAGCEEAIRQRVDDLMRVQEELQGLDGRTCTGREYWRDKDHPTKTAKLYVLHSIDQACPLHGEPEPEDRLRVYVGSKFARIREARRAMELEDERRRLEAQRGEIQRGLASCSYHLQSFYSLLGYTVGEDGRLEPR